MCEFEQIKKESGYMNKPLLDIKDLNVGFQIDGNFVQILHDVSFSINKGDSCALVGESIQEYYKQNDHAPSADPPQRFLAERSCLKIPICSA